MSFYNSTNDNIISFKSGVTAPTTGSNITYILPITDPTAGQVLSASLPTAGVSTLSWASMSAGIGVSINSITTNTTAGSSASTNYIYLCTNAITVTLPTAVGNSNIYCIKRNGTSTVVIDTTGSQTIDGSLTASILVEYQSIELISNGSNWSII